MTPKVTVLMAVKDGEEYLLEAVQSALAQTFLDFEVLVVDDGSRDRTPALLESIADPRLRVLRNETNLGEAPSRNRGLREARGEYVAVLDHDDVCRPDRLEQEVAVLDAEPTVAVVGSWATLIVDDGHPVGHVRSSIRRYVDFLYWCLVGGIQLPHSSAMYRRDIVLGLDGYDETLNPSEDLDLLLRLALHRCDARIVEQELIRYRLHPRQLSRVHEERQQERAWTAHAAFLGALAGDSAIDVGALRLLLAGDTRASGSAGIGAATVDDLERLLAHAAERLDLARDERLELERRVRLRVLASARRAGWRRSSLPLVRYGVAAGGGEAVGGTVRYVLAPAVDLAGAGTRRVMRRLLHMPLVRHLEGPARRSRAARRLYSWLLGRL